MALFLAVPAIAAAQDGAPAPDRVLGVLPNFGTVEHDAPAAPIERSGMFEATARNTFDPVVFPLTGLMTALGEDRSRGYAGRYATSFADNAIGNFMTSAVFPSMLRQDPRYYQRGGGSAGSRAWYALSRVAVTRSAGGTPQFNYSEVLGNLAGGAAANAYYPQAGRSLSAIATRWATQVLWDAAANELKEFWPDVRQRLRSARR